MLFEEVREKYLLRKIIIFNLGALFVKTVSISFYSYLDLSFFLFWVTIKSAANFVIEQKHTNQ